MIIQARTSPRIWAAPLLVGVFTATVGCELKGIEPDEIDIAHEGGSDESSSGAEGEAGTGDGDGDNGTGDGDPTTTGDGDGDPSTTGDGDGDPSTTTSTGDGDGDGDGDDTSCLGFSPIEVFEGDNDVEVFDGVSELAPSCGGTGPETVYRFEAPSAGVWAFTISDPQFVDVLALVSSCAPLEEFACSPTPAIVQQDLSQGQVVYVIVDSDEGIGTATLNIAPL